MQIPDILYDLIVTPREGMEELRLFRKSLFSSIMIVLFAMLSQTVANFLIQSSPIGYLGFSLSFGLINKFLLMLLFLIFITTIFHFLASWNRTTAKAKDLFILMGASLFPLMLLPAFAIISKALGTVGYFLYFIFYLLLICWIVNLQVQSIKYVYAISTTKAFLIYISPMLISTMLIFVAFILGIGSLILLLSKNL